MENLEHSLFIVRLFNKVLGKPLASLLAALGIKVANPQAPIPDFVVMVIIVGLLLAFVFTLTSRKFSILPSKRQSILELIVSTLDGIIVDIIGEEGKKFTPVIGTVGLFIFTCNLIGLAPGFMSPTSKLTVTAGCALVVFVYYHLMGIKSQGIFKYLKHFIGPTPALAPLLLPIEIISHFSRPVSLSLRLFGNIFAEELIIVIIASIVPFVLPIPFMVVALFTATIQSFVFMLLSCIYIAGAISHGEDH